MAPGTPGIQSEIMANVGEQITVDFVIDLSDASALSAWQYSIRFNTDNLVFVSRQEVAPDGFGFFESDTQMVDDLPSGFFSGSVMTISAGQVLAPVPVSDPFALAW